MTFSRIPTRPSSTRAGYGLVPLAIGWAVAAVVVVATTRPISWPLLALCGIGLSVSWGCAAIVAAIGRPGGGRVAQYRPALPVSSSADSEQLAGLSDSR